jgi:hypothetical protein
MNPVSDDEKQIPFEWEPKSTNAFSTMPKEQKSSYVLPCGCQKLKAIIANPAATAINRKSRISLNP